MKSLSYALVLTCLIFLSGCVAGSPPQAINETPLVRVANIDVTGLFAADEGGQKVAIARSGFYLLDLESGFRQKLSSDSPVALAWGLDGSSLAVAFPSADYETRLVLYTSQGVLLYETLLPVALSQMVWSDRGDLLVTGFALKVYSFGGNLRQGLYKVTREEVLETVLSDTTLKPSTLKSLVSIMQKVQPVVFSPQGDELVFAKLHDPPAFQPYLQLRHMNWESGVERSLRKIPLQPLQLNWDDAKGSVAVMAQSSSFSLSLWTSAESSAEQRHLPSYRFSAGRLYESETLLADWGTESRLQILVDGRYLLAQNGQLYLGDGLKAVPRIAYSERSWTLRRWRFEGLITQDEYLNLLPLGENL